MASLSIPMLRDMKKAADGADASQDIPDFSQSEVQEMQNAMTKQATAALAAAAKASDPSSKPVATGSHASGEGKSKDLPAVMPSSPEFVRSLPEKAGCFIIDSFVVEDYSNAASPAPAAPLTDVGTANEKSESKISATSATEPASATPEPNSADTAGPPLAAQAAAQSPNVSVDSRPRVDSAFLEKNKNRFCIDLDPRLILSRGPLVDVLIRMDVSQYMEFRSVDKVFSARSDGSLWRVPLSKSIVFKDNELSLGEKRHLMRIINSVMGNPKSLNERARAREARRVETFKDRPFAEYLADTRAPQKLREMLTYPLAHAMFDQMPAEGAPPRDKALLTREALARLKAMLSSLGRYGAGAYLYPAWGTSEVPQAFTRLCAVHGGMYLLRFGPRAIVMQCDAESKTKKRFAGVVTRSGQFISAAHLATSRDYAPAQVAGEFTAETVSRAVLVLDRPLMGTVPVDAKTPSAAKDHSAASCLLVVPPRTLRCGNKNPIRVLQLGSNMAVCPRGLTLVHLSVPNATGNTAKQDLEAIVEEITRSPRTAANGAAAGTPFVVSALYYRQRVRSAIVSADTKSDTETTKATQSPDNVHVLEDMSTAFDLSSAVGAAESAFRRICPGGDFLPGRMIPNKSIDDREGLDDLMNIDIDDVMKEVPGRDQGRLLWAPLLGVAKMTSQNEAKAGEV